MASEGRRIAVVECARVPVVTETGGADATGARIQFIPTAVRRITFVESTELPVVAIHRYRTSTGARRAGFTLGARIAIFTWTIERDVLAS